MKIKKSIFILMVIVLITILGTVLYKGEKYNLIIIASFALSCLPFYFKYENSKPKIREVVVLATEGFMDYLSFLTLRQESCPN